MQTWSPTSGDARGPSVVFEAVDNALPRTISFFSQCRLYIYEFCPLPDPDVGHSIFVCDVEHTSFILVCTRASTSLFCACFGQCPGFCTICPLNSNIIRVQCICHSWQHTGVVHLPLQADGKVAFEDIPVFGVCRPASGRAVANDPEKKILVFILWLGLVGIIN